MAHPIRSDMVSQLVRELGRDVPVVWDKINDRHDTGIRAVQAYDPGCTHHLVIQDDAVPCLDLLAGVERALEWVPADNPVSLYLGRVRPFRRAVETAVLNASAASWITMDGIYWGPGIVVPTAAIPDIVKWWDTDRVTNYDRRLSRWFEKRKLRCWYTWPSLVDHRDGQSLAHRNVKSGRHAHRFADRSALKLDWSGQVVEMARTGKLDARRQALAKR
jgi:hypothetical protein